MIRDALDPDLLQRLLDAHDRVYDDERVAGCLDTTGAMHAFAFVGRDPVYLELLDLPSTFPLIWGLLGWNIYVYHCHIDQHPPTPQSDSVGWGWHRDGGRQNFELDAISQQPRLSVKVGFFLTDLSRGGGGQLAVLPGSHREPALVSSRRDTGDSRLPNGAVEVSVRAGDAVIFDRRLYHSRTTNTSQEPRKAIFLAYTYRWVRARDDDSIDRTSKWFQELSPVRRQLLGAGSDARSFWGLGDDDYPLYDWLHARGLITSARNMRPPSPPTTTEHTTKDRTGM